MTETGEDALGRCHWGQYRVGRRVSGRHLFLSKKWQFGAVV